MYSGLRMVLVGGAAGVVTYSIGRLLGISRSGLYYQPKGISEEDLNLMKLIDRQYLATPFYGARKMVACFLTTSIYWARALE